MDEILYKKARNTVQALIKDKKFLQEKLSGNIGKPKELWKTILKIGFTRQKGCHNKHMPQNELTFSPRAIANTFKNHFPNLTRDLVKKFPDPTGKFGIPSVRQLYKGINFREKTKFEKVSSVSILNLLKECKTNKAAGVDNLDGSNILCTPIAKTCNLSVKLASFLDKYTVAKVKSLYKKGLKTDPKNSRPTSLLPLISKIIERVIHD